MLDLVSHVADKLAAEWEALVTSDAPWRRLLELAPQSERPAWVQAAVSHVLEMAADFHRRVICVVHAWPCRLLLLSDAPPETCLLYTSPSPRD
eukprot:13193972-Alexandrium_andersonii.AAC.1